MSGGHGSKKQGRLVLPGPIEPGSPQVRTRSDTQCYGASSIIRLAWTLGYLPTKAAHTGVASTDSARFAGDPSTNDSRVTQEEFEYGPRQDP